MSELEDLKQLADAYSIKYEDKGNGHIQLSNHGVLVNYWPLSKNRTVHFNGQTIKHCSNWDAVKLCMKSGVKGLKPKESNITKNRPEFSLNSIKTNPAGVKHLYNGETPPWEFPTFIACWPDILRVRARKILDKAEYMDGVEA